MTQAALRRLVLVAQTAIGLSLAVPALAQDYDVLIRGGTLFDGSLSPRKAGDVAIKGDKIVLVGEIPASATATKVIDAKGKYVTPGFIDPHSHAAPRIETQAASAAPALLYQGVTTVMINPDGGGPSDLKPQLADIAKWGPGVNVAPMIGHNAVRTAVMGLVNRKASPAELAQMSGLIKSAMDLGAFGFSSGPFTIPGKYSDTAELVALSKTAAAYQYSFYTSHLRDEATYDIGVVAATQELITIGKEAKIRAVVTHQKTIGPSVWGKSTEIVEMMKKAQGEGVDLWADQYPYAASSIGLAAAIVPGWAQEGGPKGIAERIKNPEQRALMRKEMVENIERRAGANAIMIRDFAPDPSFSNQRLDDIAKRGLKEPVDAALDILSSGQDVGIISFTINEGDVETFMKQPWTMTSTDGELHEMGVGAAHPRSYGAFSRKLRRYVIDKPVLTWEQAIHSSTGLTADVFHVDGRGYLKPGNFADVLVIDPQTVRDVATYEKPHAYSVGMNYVLVNGKVAVSEGKTTEGHFGRILLRAR